MEQVARQFGVVASRMNLTKSMKFPLRYMCFYHVVIHDMEEMSMCLLDLL